MLYAYIGTTFAQIENVKLSRMIGGAGNCSFDVAISYFENPYIDFRNLNIEVYYRDSLIASGFVESSKIKQKDEQLSHIGFTCATDLALLTRIGGKSNANYQNQPAIFIVDDLLSKTSDWRLGYVEGFDLTLNLTKDLRGKSDLLSQLKLLSESTPDYYFRYGGIVDGYHTLDIGPLRDGSGTSFTQAVNAARIEKMPQAKRKIYEVEAFGGSTDTREIYLSDAYDYDNALGSHSNYPIIQKADGTWVVRDLSASNGDTLTKYYNNVKPTSDTPTSTEIEEAGYALWLTCVNEFIRANNQNDIYEIEAKVGSELTDNLNSAGNYPNILDGLPQPYLNMLPCQTTYINGRVHIPIYNMQTQYLEWRAIFDINSSEIISDIDFAFTNASLLEIKIKTGIESYQELYDADIILKKEISEKEKSTFLGVGYAEPAATGVVSVIEVHSSTAPDTVMNNGDNAKLFSLNMPAVPPGTTEVRFSLYTDVRQNVTIETIQVPALPSAGYIGKFNINGNWDTSNSLTLTGIFIFR